MKDKNQFSISGDGTGACWVNDRLVYHPSLGLQSVDGLGIAAVVRGEYLEIQILWTLVARPGDSDLLKCSGLRKTRIFVDTLDGRQAAEDAADVNHCHDLVVMVNDLWPGKKYCGTIKGTSSGVTIVVGRQHGHGGETDWDYGNFADQGNGRTTGCKLTTNVVDRSAARVRLLSADPVECVSVDGQRYEVQKLNQGWFYPLIDLWKGILKIFGIK